MSRRAALLLPLCCLVASCGGPAASDEVRSTLSGFAKATAAHDYQALCDDYFAPALVSEVEQAGLPCEAAIRPEISATKRPSLKIGHVEVHGTKALARVHTSAANQPASDDTIRLVRVRGHWRIASLETAGPPAPAAP